MRTLTFEPSGEDFANPERGFFTIRDPVHFSNENAPPLDPDALAAWGEENDATLVSKRYLLADFRTRDLSEAFLSEVEADLEATREAGFKMIPRFTYVWNLDASERDAPLEWTLRHIEQLAPILEEHAEVVDHVSGGFIGRWGEMHTSTEGHVAPGTVELTESGVEIVEALLGAVPDERMVALRYPQQIERLVGEPVGPGAAWDGSDRSRVGFFNDGLLYDETDFGTFSADPEKRAEQEAFIEAATEFAVTSGEPAGAFEGHPFGVDPVARLDRQNFVSLSAEQTGAEADGVYDDWRERGLYDDVSRSLGYRFALEEARLPDAVAPGGTLALSLDVANEGFARAHNARPLELVLRDAQGREWVAETGVDARAWDGGETTTVSLAASLPEGLAEGSYELLLGLPDPSPELADDPRYAVRLANEDVWEAEAGLNRLAAIAVEAGAPAGGPSDGVAFTLRDGAGVVRGTEGSERLLGTTADEVFETLGGRDRVVLGAAGEGGVGSDVVTDFDVDGGGWNGRGETSFDLLELDWGGERRRLSTEADFAELSRALARDEDEATGASVEGPDLVLSFGAGDAVRLAGVVDGVELSAGELILA